MEEDGTCLLDVINDPDALGAFLTSDQQDEEDTKQTMDNMDDIMAGGGGGIGSSSSSKPAYPDFLSMAMAEANLEPDFGSLDQEPFFTATVDSAELGGVPEQRTSVTLDSLVEDTNISANNANEEGSVGIIQVKDEPVKTHETSAAAKTAISAVQRLISQSSQPLHHGALAPDIPTQKMIHYKAEDHPQGSKLLGEAIGQAGGIIQPISIQAGTSQVVTNPVQQLTTQALDTLQHKQVSAKQLATQQLVQQSGQGLQLNAQLQTLSPAVQQQAGLQQVLIGQSHQLQGAGNVQQLVLGSVQPQINVIQGQANILQPGHLGTQVLQLQRPQLRPKMGVVGAQPAMKQIQLVLNPQTGVISQVPGNIQLRGQLISQQPGMIGSPQVIIQNQAQQQQPQHSQAQQTTSKAKTITTSTSVSSQPVITMAASEGNIIVLTNSTPIAQTSVSQKTNTVTVNSSTTHVASSSSNSNSQPSKQSKSKPGKTSKTKSRRSQQRTSSSGSKPVTTVSVTTVTNSSAGGQSQSVQSLGSIPSIQASSPSPVTSLSNASGLTSAGGPIATRIGQAVTPSQNNVLQHLNIPGIKQGTLTIRNKDPPPSSVVVSGGSVHTSEPAPVISHQAGTVHYRPRQVVPKQQSDKNPALQQLVQNLRAQGNNERLRSLRQLQKLLQQNPQASQQLQELMKSKLVGTKPEVSVKKPPVTSSDVTKPPNVYLQPQPANSLPFQTGSKLFNTSAPSGGLTIPPLFINKSNARMSHSLIVPTSTEVSKPSTLQNLSGVLSSFVNQATTATSTSQQVRFSDDKDTFLDNLDFLDAKTVGQTAAPAGESHSAIPGVNQSPVIAKSAAAGSSLAAANGNPLLQPTQKITVTTTAAQSFPSNLLPLSSVQLSVGSNSSAVLDVPSTVSQATAQYSVGLANAATNLLNNQPKLVVSTLAETISSLVNSSKASFINKNPPVAEGKDEKRELNIGVSAIHGLQGQPEVAATLRVTSPVQQAPVQAARPEMIQSASLQNLNPASAVVSRPAITLTSEQIGIRAQQQLQQIQARIQQLMSRQVRSDLENRQLQQLLHYRQKVIVKVKAQLAQLSHQQRLANLSMGQQSRDKPGTADAGPVTSPSSQINIAAVSTPSSQINIGTVSTAAQVATKAGGAFSSLLVPHGQAIGKNASTGLNVHVLAQSPQQQQQQQQYSPSVSPAGVSGQKQIQNALITSTTSKQDTLKNVRVGKHKNSESDKKNLKKIKMTSEPNITLSQSLNFKGSNSTESSALKAKLEEGSSSLSNSLPAGQLQFPSGGSSTQGMSMQRAHLSKTTQVKPQQYQQTMKMLEEKLRSMSPAQQRQFLMQYQPLLQRLSLAGQKIMAGKAAAASQSSLASINSQPEQGATAQRKTSQGSMSKESKSPKRNSSKPVTPTLLQLISGEVAEAKTKKHEKMMKKQNRSEMLLQQLKKDQSLVTHAELKREFTSRSEAVGKLLAFHVCQNDSPMEEHLEKFDKEFEDHSMHLLDKKDEMLAKYRYLLLRESMRRGPSAEMVMLDRMVLQDERMNFEYEKQLSKNPDTQNRLLAIIKPNQSKKERFLSAAASAAALSSSMENPATLVIPKQETSLPPKKRALIEPVVIVKPLEPEVSTISEVPISEPQITKNDFKTKITIKIPKQSYQPLSPSPSSCDTIHSTVSSPDLRSPKSEAGSESGASSVRSDISSPRVRLRRHSTLQALLMSESPLEVSMDELKGKKKPWKQTSNPSSLSVSDKTPAKDTGEKASRSRRNGKDGLTNGRRSNSSVVSEEAMSVFDFDEDTGSKDSLILPVSAANSPFEPMDVLQDSLQDEMNSTINSILGLQKASPGDGSQQEDDGGGGSQDTLLPSAVFESHSIDDDDDFYDSVDTLSKITSYSSMLDSGGGGMPGDGSSRDTVASLQAELDIMMEGDDSQESKPSDHDLEAAVNSILF